MPGISSAIQGNKFLAAKFEVIKNYPDMKIVKSQSGDFTRAKGKEVMEAFLKSPDGKNITALFAHNDDMALGAIQAMEEAGSAWESEPPRCWRFVVSPRVFPASRRCKALTLPSPAVKSMD